ncbi:MAG: hypothetical protein GXP13_03060 [Gammaproteobacteria bacterium]|nr:hypothetical protein [Gammaproteobacteria bacterium]
MDGTRWRGSRSEFCHGWHYAAKPRDGREWPRQPPRQYPARREPASAGVVIGVPFLWVTFLWASKDLYRDVLMLRRPGMAVSSASDSVDGTSPGPSH